MKVISRGGKTNPCIICTDAKSGQRDASSETTSGSFGASMVQKEWSAEASLRSIFVGLKSSLSWLRPLLKSGLKLLPHKRATISQTSWTIAHVWSAINMIPIPCPGPSHLLSPCCLIIALSIHNLEEDASFIHQVPFSYLFCWCWCVW